MGVREHFSEEARKRRAQARDLKSKAREAAKEKRYGAKLKSLQRHTTVEEQRAKLRAAKAKHQPKPGSGRIAKVGKAMDDLGIGGGFDIGGGGGSGLDDYIGMGGAPRKRKSTGKKRKKRK